MKGGYSNIEDMMRFYNNNIQHNNEYIRTNDPVHLYTIAENLQENFETMDRDLLDTVNGLSIDKHLQIKQDPSDEFLIDKLQRMVKNDIDEIDDFIYHGPEDIKESLRKNFYKEMVNKTSDDFMKDIDIDHPDFINKYNENMNDKLKEIVYEKSRQHEQLLDLQKNLNENNEEIIALKFLVFAYKLWYSIRIKHMSPEEFANSYRK